ncbi:hypothetical protein NADFUDRAFT_81569 [Nadsonia fulvescens var. elongata DSM 6958]|uniref:Bromodomain associated domain-containing protein n=1 Tax=Nadsonia fulvescens var. elongata DSM 6958 TaxID=857566 RepID=A0A1E3PPY5_9ASCO|nr:hypothetical protein NADFUDRAFT_81569 [Nadsonia fulvescens var. elongata DSM 6958]
MQQTAYMHSNQFKPYEIVEINESDLDVESRLPNRDPYNEEVSRAALKRNVAKISMHSGFERTEVVAIDVLTDLAADYMTKLGKTLVMYMQNMTSGPEDISYEDVILNTLEDNGLESINDLDSYVREDVERHGSKLKELNGNLTGFLADLLRPTLANNNGSNELRSNQFNDGSEQFISGDFSEEIGEDFFGFRELGLDKEFGLLSSSVPLHLLHSRLNASAMFEQSSIQTTDLIDVPDYEPIDRKAINNVIGLLRPFFIARLDATKNSEVLLEGDQLPPKQRNIRPKVPPTGKINGIRKKPLNRVFFRKRPELELEPEVRPIPEARNGSEIDTTEQEHRNNEKLDIDGSQFSVESDVALPVEPVAVGSLMGTTANDENIDGYDNEDFGDLF